MRRTIEASTIRHILEAISEAISEIRTVPSSVTCATKLPEALGRLMFVHGTLLGAAIGDIRIERDGGPALESALASLGRAIAAPGDAAP